MCLSWPHTCIIRFQVRQMCYQAIPVHSMLSWTKLHLNGLEVVWLIHLKENQRPIFHMRPSKPPLFHSKFLHCGLFYFHLLYNIFDYFYWLSFEVILNYSSLIHRFIYSMFAESYSSMWMSIVYWLHIPTLYLWNSVEASLIVHRYIKVLSSYNMISSHISY